MTRFLAYFFVCTFLFKDLIFICLIDKLSKRKYLMIYLRVIIPYQLFFKNRETTSRVSVLAASRLSF